MLTDRELALEYIPARAGDPTLLDGTIFGYEIDYGAIPSAWKALHLTNGSR